MKEEISLCGRDLRRGEESSEHTFFEGVIWVAIGDSSDVSL